MSKIRVRKRGKTFSYSFEISKTPRRQKEKGGFATENDALEAGMIAFAEWKSGNIGSVSPRMTVKEFLTSWVENIARPNIKRATYISYSVTIRVRIVPYIGDVKLSALRARDIDMMLQRLAAEGFARMTIQTTKTILHTALKYAVYPGELIRSNPAVGLSIPRCAPKKVIKRTVITPEQFAAIPRTSRYYHVYKIMYHTGMRISEVMGLSWDDIDFSAGTISIVRQREADGYFDTPKTETSTRTIYADAVLLSFLRTLRATQAKEEMSFGEAYQLAYEDTNADGDLVMLPKKIAPRPGLIRRALVCVRRGGMPCYHSNVESALRKMGLNAHSFRHTHATRLIEAGAKPVAVASRLGHADATITQNLYAHSTDAMQRETSAIFETFVGSSFS